jgi:uncharacterized protein
MKILIALNHPAHYFLFKYILSGFRKNGYEVDIVIREKDILEKILKSEGQAYIKINEKKKRNKNAFSVISKGILELVTQDINLYRHVKKINPDFLLGTDIAITHIGKLKRIPSFVFNEDDFEINKLFCKASYSFADYIIAPEYTSVGSFKEKKIAYNGIQKMAYLNPKYFKPDIGILEELNLKKEAVFFIIRLVSLTSGHDIEGKHIGIDEVLLSRLITLLETKGRVFITSEDVLSKDFEKYHVRIAPNKMHDLMYFASLFIGDSQSMCAEAGILGTPFIRFNDFVGKIEYLNDLENNYNLGWGVKTNEPERIFSIINELFQIPNFKNRWQEKKDKLFREKIDLTAFIIWLIENYPESAKIMKEKPDETQARFR